MRMLWGLCLRLISFALPRDRTGKITAGRLLLLLCLSMRTICLVFHVEYQELPTSATLQIRTEYLISTTLGEIFRRA